MQSLIRESLCHDPIHGYIPFVSVVDAGETAERAILDHRWVQRLRQIHQLQTAWWVYPSAEHTRFQHVVGAMHMAGRAVETLYPSLAEVAADVPSRGYVQCTARMAALLHDVGHGPFGHFFDQHYLKDYGLTHETLGAWIIEHELKDLLLGLRRCPGAELAAEEQLDPGEIAYLIQRPRSGEGESRPRWLRLLRSLFCGIYTVDNMDFVLRDAYMSGYSARAFDLERLLRYSFFSEQGLTIHQRGVGALVRFMAARSELFRAVYFHRTVRAIDKTLEELFAQSRPLLFSGNPLEHLDEYRQFTEWSLLIDVARWPQSDDARKRELGERWRRLLGRQVEWITAAERNLVFQEGDAEMTHIFSDAKLVEAKLREQLSPESAPLELRVDIARHVHRPDTQAGVAGQNFLYSQNLRQVRPLTDEQLIRQLPISHRSCRVYVRQNAPPSLHAEISRALDGLLGQRGLDDLTNM